MNNGNYSIKNLFINLTKKQKVAALMLLILAVVMTVVIIVAAGAVSEDVDGNEANGGDIGVESSVDADSVISEGVQWGDEGDRVVDVPVNTEYNDEHEYTLIEYIPASRYEYKEYGDGQVGIRDYWWAMENTAVEKGIVVSANVCDVEGNTAEANEFLKNLPVNLSEYTIVYQTHVDNMPCEAQ